MITVTVVGKGSNDVFVDSEGIMSEIAAEGVDPMDGALFWFKTDRDHF